MNKLFFVTGLGLLLSGCAVSQAQLNQTSDTDLCVRFLSLPSYNINHSARAEEISRRGLNCREPQYQAALQAAKDQEARIKAAEAAAPKVYVQSAQPARSAPISCTTSSTGGGNSFTNCY